MNPSYDESAFSLEQTFAVDFAQRLDELIHTIYSTRGAFPMSSDLDIDFYLSSRARSVRAFTTKELNNFKVPGVTCESELTHIF